MSYKKIVVMLLFGMTVQALFALETGKDWPGFRGLEGNGSTTETGLLKSWPDGGPKLVWKQGIGVGFSSITLVDGRIYTMFQSGEADARREFAVCMNAEDGSLVWQTEVGPFFDDQFGNGPRATPTVDGDQVFVLGSHGNLAALNLATGDKQWEVDFIATYGSKLPQWGFSTSPLVEGDVVIVEVGGGEGELYASFDRKTGKELWKMGSGDPTYCTPIRVNLHGTQQFITARGLQECEVVAFNAKGEELWTHLFAKTTMTIASPLYVAPDKFLISATGNGGAMMIQVNDKYEVTELWKSNRFKNHFSGSVYHDGYIYGFDSALLKCIDANTGEQKWVTRGFGKGSLILAEGHLYVLGDRGRLALVKATPDAFTEVSGFQALEGKSWTAPTLVDGKLYLRNGEQLAVYNVSAKESVQ